MYGEPGDSGTVAVAVNTFLSVNLSVSTDNVHDVAGCATALRAKTMQVQHIPTEKIRFIRCPSRYESRHLHRARRHRNALSSWDTCRATWAHSVPLIPTSVVHTNRRPTGPSYRQFLAQSSTIISFVVFALTTQPLRCAEIT